MKSNLTKTYSQSETSVPLKLSQSIKNKVQFGILALFLASLGLALNYKFGKIIEERKTEGQMKSFVIR